ncbi:hypothetical protein Hdeb2414_s0008g00277521 [Helianthus debilis subsp. tardiflorus]
MIAQERMDRTSPHESHKGSGIAQGCVITQVSPQSHNRVGPHLNLGMIAQPAGFHTLLGCGSGSSHTSAAGRTR